jgi:hypothetical protein
MSFAPGLFRLRAFGLARLLVMSMLLGSCGRTDLFSARNGSNNIGCPANVSRPTAAGWFGHVRAEYAKPNAIRQTGTSRLRGQAFVTLPRGRHRVPPTVLGPIDVVPLGEGLAGLAERLSRV